MFEGKIETYLDTPATTPAKAKPAKPRPMTPHQLLRHDPQRFFAMVAATIKERGWSTSELENCHGEVCLVGAIGITLGYRVAGGGFVSRAGRTDTPLPDVTTAVQLLGFPHVHNATHWNDALASGRGAVLRRLQRWKPAK